MKVDFHAHNYTVAWTSENNTRFYFVRFGMRGYDFSGKSEIFCLGAVSRVRGLIFL